MLTQSRLGHGSHPSGHEPYNKNGGYAKSPLVGTFNIEADVIQKGEKVGAIGLEPTTSRM